ncbi:hemerythrin domain-containing protein [Streptomyces sp. NBC_01485]|uniref:hemerythrin domain-containing protein n=1 Tax=Streptomyces sp. NBC_01485 TaxID=2903884 RepID=UPI002E342597|nr:hemerythrin domain-containing protein [Streptomyces sp. NBC_01485]
MVSLDADRHRTVARIQEELAALLAGITIADPERFRTELDAMARELNAHLDHEEKTVVPLLAHVPWPPARASERPPEPPPRRS